MAKSSGGRARMRGARGDVMEIWQRPKQSWPALILGVLIRWRAELTVLLLLAVSVWWLHGHLSGPSLWAAALGPIVVVLLVPQSRRFVLSRFWCVLDRHRIRSCLRTARVRTMNLDGALPFLLWARPTKTGERIWMWTRAGSSASELEGVLGYIASACFAREARVRRKRSMSTLVAVEVIRRDPLETSKPVDSPLARLTSLVPGKHGATDEGSEPITAATITPVPAQESKPSAAVPAQSRATRTSSPASQSAPQQRPAVVAGGDDVTDYI